MKTCSDLAANQIWCWSVINFTWAMSLYYFFAHLDRILNQQSEGGQRGQLRTKIYAVYLIFLTLYNVTVGFMVPGTKKINQHKFKTRCVRQIYNCQDATVTAIQFILFVEIAWLTASF